MDFTQEVFDKLNQMALDAIKADAIQAINAQAVTDRITVSNQLDAIEQKRVADVDAIQKMTDITSISTKLKG